jgi:hypothetical protein
MKRGGGPQKMAVVPIKYGTLQAIEIGLVSKFCRRLFVDIFPFPFSTVKLFSD